MPRKPQPWFRQYVEAFHDRKMLRLTPTQRWLFVAMCGAGRESPELGRLLVAVDVPMTDKEVAEYADVPLREVAKTLPLLDQLGMVRRGEDGVLVILNMERRQYASDTSAQRTADYRARQGSDNDPGTPRDNVVTSLPRHNGRHSDGRSDVPETEQETEQIKNPPELRSDPPTGGVATTPPKKPPAARGTNIDPLWLPALNLRQWALEEFPHLTGEDLRAMTEEFVDYWRGVPGTKGRKLDWPATWRNRIRDQAPRRRPNRTTPPGDIDLNAARARAAAREAASA